MWFGDERGYNATNLIVLNLTLSCGLVMKEDITQRNRSSTLPLICCGLVMKEDITQQTSIQLPHARVVVW